MSDDRAGEYVKRQRREKQPGKGDAQRHSDKEKFDQGWDRIFGKPKKDKK